MLVLCNKTKRACKGRIPYKSFCSRKPGVSYVLICLGLLMIGEPVQLLEQLEPGHLPEVPHLDSASVQLSFTHSSSVHFSFIFTIPKDWLCRDIIFYTIIHCWSFFSQRGQSILYHICRVPVLAMLRFHSREILKKCFWRSTLLFLSHLRPISIKFPHTGIKASSN